MLDVLLDSRRLFVEWLVRSGVSALLTHTSCWRDGLASAACCVSDVWYEDNNVRLPRTVNDMFWAKRWWTSK